VSGLRGTGQPRYAVAGDESCTRPRG
jgi:hypothetical protein